MKSLGQEIWQSTGIALQDGDAGQGFAEARREFVIDFHGDQTLKRVFGRGA